MSEIWTFAATTFMGFFAITIGTFAVLCLITLIIFLSGQKLVAAIGTSALSVVTRFMGLILAVIGTQMAIEGIQGAFRLSQ